MRCPTIYWLFLACAVLLNGCKSSEVMRPEYVVTVSASGAFVVGLVDAKEPAPQGELVSGAQHVTAGVTDRDLVLFPFQSILSTIEQPKVRVIHSDPLLHEGFQLDVVGKLDDVAGAWQPVGARAFRIRSVSLSPSGTQIVFASKETPVSEWGVWVMNVDGTEPTFIGLGDTPSWIGDNELLYSRELSGRFAVYRVGVDGSGLKAIVADGKRDCIQPSLSPDAEHVAFVKAERGKPWNRDIWIHSLKSGESRQLTQDPARDDAPVWSRDGTAILFRSTRWALWGIWRIPLPADFGKRVVNKRSKPTGKGS